jgi:hypothetical protein
MSEKLHAPEPTLAVPVKPSAKSLPCSREFYEKMKAEGRPLAIPEFDREVAKDEKP